MCQIKYEQEEENTSEGIILQIEKKAEMAGALNAYIYLIMDAHAVEY